MQVRAGAKAPALCVPGQRHRRGLPARSAAIALTLGFTPAKPVDVYRLAVTSVANWSAAAAALIPGIRCW